MNTRAQAMILNQNALLFVKHEIGERSVWCFPGGRVMPGETPEVAVQREVQEETGLQVAIQSLVSDEGDRTGNYQRIVTFLCTPVGGRLALGEDPERTGLPPVLADVSWRPLVAGPEWTDIDVHYLQRAGLVLRG